MRSRIKSLLPWLLFGVVILIALVQIGLFLVADYAQEGPLILASFAVYSLIPIVSASVGALIVSRQPRNRIGWLILLLAILLVLENSATSYLVNFDGPPPNPALAFYLAAWYTGIGWVLTPVTIFFIVLLFPTDQLLTRRWRWVVAYGLGVVIYTVIASTFGHGWEPFEAGWFLANPLAIIPGATLNDIPLYQLPLPFLPVAFVLLCALSLIIRYRRVGIVERKQIKWFLFAGSLFLLIMPLNFVAYLLELENIGRDLSNLSFVIGILAFPVAIGIAILRYNLFDIDLIIRKTLIYAVLTALLALVYFGVIILLQSVFEAVSGQQSPIIIVVSTLVIAALFAPLRRRVQDFIDRRFYRRRYDAERTLTDFGQFVRDETDLDALTAELLRVTEETMQPEQVVLWLNLADDKRVQSG